MNVRFFETDIGYSGKHMADFLTCSCCRTLYRAITINKVIATLTRFAISARPVRSALCCTLFTLIVACGADSEIANISGGDSSGSNGAETVAGENGSTGLGSTPDWAGESVPDSPTGFTVVREPYSLNVGFNEIPGATSYRIYYSSAPGVTSQSGSVTGSQSPITIAGLARGIPYFLRLSAFNSAGESALSVEHRAATLALPGVLQTVNVEPANGAVRVSWEGVEDATAYTVFTSTVAGDVSAVSQRTSLLQTSIEGLINGTTYFVSVQGENTQGAGPRSSELAVTPGADAGGAGWSIDQLISEPVDFFARDIYVGGAAVNDSGVTAASWLLTSKTENSSQLYVNHTDSDGNWREETLLATDSGTSRVAVTPDGRIVVAWVGEYTNDYGLQVGSTLLSRRYVNGMWTEVEEVADITSGSVYSLELDADGENNVVVTWKQSGVNVWVNRLTDAGWSVPTRVSDSVLSVSDPLVATSADNRAIVVWLQDHRRLDLSGPNDLPKERSLYAIEFNGSNWGVARRIGHVDLQGLDAATSLRLDVNAEGSAVAVWRQRKRFEREITGYRIDGVWFDTSSQTWTAPETILDRDRLVSPDDVSLNSDGDAAMIIRSSIPGDTGFPVEVSLFDSQNRTWGTPNTIVNVERRLSLFPTQTEIRSNGDVFSVWEDLGDVYWREYDAGAGEWAPAVKLSNGDDGTMAFATSRNGHSVVATDYNWFTLAVYALRFRP